MNPFLYLFNVFQLIVSHYVIVFDKALINDILKIYPFVSSKKFYVFEHGHPSFNYEKTYLNKNLINFGFFGRNMPYKNVANYVELSKKFKFCKFYIFGKGYESSYANIEIEDGFIENNKYFSLMFDVDYVVLPYLDISFSGILSDAISLNKRMIVSKKILNTYRNKNMISIDDFQFASKETKLTNYYKSDGWNSYYNSLNNLIN